MKNGATYFKYGVILIGIIVVFLLFKRCGNGSGKPSHTDTIRIKVDSIVTHTIHDTTYVPRLVSEYIPKEVHDTLESFEVIHPDTVAILKNYYITRHYIDTQRIEHGTIVIDDYVSQNKITKRRLFSDIKTVETVKTVTLSQPRKIIGYAGISAMGSSQNFLYAIGLNTGIKARNDKYYGVGALLTRDGNLIYQAEIHVPIRLKKR